MSIKTFIDSGSAIEWLRQSRDRNSLKSHELHEQNETFSPLRFIRVAKINLFSDVIVSNHFWNPRNTVGNVSCRSINDCVIPVKFLQNSLNIGTRVGRTNSWNSDSICPVVVFSKTAGNNNLNAIIWNIRIYFSAFEKRYLNVIPIISTSCWRSRNRSQQVAWNLTRIKYLREDIASGVCCRN